MNCKERKISHTRILEILDYNKETGSFTWLKKTSKFSSNKVGEVAGYKNKDGYLAIGIDGYDYLLHRVAWFYVHGVWPENEIDHINGGRDQNFIENLRDVTTKVNQENQKKARNRNEAGFLGVTKRKSNKNYQARIRVDKKEINLGSYKTAEEAHTVYISAKRKMHQGCTI